MRAGGRSVFQMKLSGYAVYQACYGHNRLHSHKCYRVYMYMCSSLPGKVLSMHALNHLTQHFLDLLNEGRNNTTELS